MKLSEIRDILDAVVLSGEHRLENEVYTGVAGDLMSDILCYAKEGSILLTGLVNKQVLNTADMVDMNTIIFVRSKMPGEEFLELAREMDFVVMTTKYILYESCGLLSQNGLKGAHIK